MDKLRQLLGPREALNAERRRSVVPITNIDPELFRDLWNLTDGAGAKPVVISSPLPVPDFKGVYGLSLGELERAWLEKLSEN
jgi:hypothetical protein